MDTLIRRRWHTPDMAEAAGRAVRLEAIADGHDESADDCWRVWLDGLDEDEAGTLASDEEIRAAFDRGWSSAAGRCDGGCYYWDCGRDSGRPGPCQPAEGHQ